LFHRLFLLLKLYLPIRPDDVQIAGTRKSVVLPQVENVERQFARQRFGYADAEPIARKFL
jgi:hypothetical protein